MSEKMKKQLVQTPIGEAKWFSINKVDKFGNYTCELHLDESERSEKFIDFIENFNSIEGKEVKLPFEKTPTGYKLKLKSKSKGQKKDNTFYDIKAPVIYNAMGQPVIGADLVNLAVGNGSQIRAKLEVKAYNFMGQDGVALGLKSVQITELVEYAGGNADYGFDAADTPNVESEEQEQSLEESTNYDF